MSTIEEIGKNIERLRAEGVKVEGSANSEQLMSMVELIPSTIFSIAEIGFKAGKSSYYFLSASKNTSVTSFDICNHDYVNLFKGLIDAAFPKRHTLIKGNSLHTVPNYKGVFDLIFIDGAHDFETALQDIRNMKAHAHDGTVLIIDDINPELKHGIGPTGAMKEAIEHGIISKGLVHKCSLGKKWYIGKYLQL